MAAAGSEGARAIAGTEARRSSAEGWEHPAQGAPPNRDGGGVESTARSGERGEGGEPLQADRPCGDAVAAVGEEGRASQGALPRKSRRRRGAHRDPISPGSQELHQSCTTAATRPERSGQQAHQGQHWEHRPGSRLRTQGVAGGNRNTTAAGRLQAASGRRQNATQQSPGQAHRTEEASRRNQAGVGPGWPTAGHTDIRRASRRKGTQDEARARRSERWKSECQPNLPGPA